MIVDDSALMRKLLVDIFAEEKEFEVCVACNSDDALAALHQFQPHVISLDINMPGKNGLECLSRIMIERPTPVVMFSALTESGTVATLEAMALGAVDYMPKPEGAISLHLEQIARMLVWKVRVAAQAKIRKSLGLTQRLREQNLNLVLPRPRNRHSRGVVIIGVSTGGPRTLEEILPQLPADFPWPVIVAQHMPANFTSALTKRMAPLCQLEVVEVMQPVLLERGHIYIARGETDAKLINRKNGIMVLPVPVNSDYSWHPNTDILVESAMKVFAPEQIIGVLLTGMGDDGAAAMTLLHAAGGRTIAEAKETAVIFGMPQALIQKGGAEVVLRSDEIAGRLELWLR
ncbi:MAG: chemotaxis-specific protein-glutamate methyltransferase CheB [Pseudomonadota bacterium]